MASEEWTLVPGQQQLMQGPDSHGQYKYIEDNGQLKGQTVTVSRCARIQPQDLQSRQSR